MTFCYPESDRAVLHDVSLEIQPGEKVALLGENGAGKTTLVKLLLGLYDPTQGVICYDGHDLRTLEPNCVWEQVSAVFQDYAMYHLTVRENVGFGKLERLNDTTAIRRAAKLGGAADFVEGWKDQFEAYLGPTFGGRDLSGGQWQKVATSRSFMRQPQFLVLDEPTAALDPQAEVEVYKRFQEMAGGRTTLLISHRIGFARLADRIIVLKEGHVVESGTHQELLASEGEYAQLFATQAKWYGDKHVDRAFDA